MGVSISVVVPVYNGAKTLRACLSAIATQALRVPFEAIVVDDGSTDETAMVAREFDVRVVRRENGGAPAARNTGILCARGEWVAFTDADCVPSRTWLARLLAKAMSDPKALGAAGKTVGLGSTSDAARFVDLMGGLDAERNLAHPVFPFAPTANVMYRREYLLEVGGFDERFATYDACDLHTRLRQRFGETFAYEPAAVVLHRHRAGWPAYWRQQLGYGVGYAQFMLAYRDYAPWTLWREVRALGGIVGRAVAASLPGGGERAIVRRGQFVRNTAQHLGFVRTYYSAKERKRW